LLYDALQYHRIFSFQRKPFYKFYGVFELPIHWTYVHNQSILLIDQLHHIHQVDLNYHLNQNKLVDHTKDYFNKFKVLIAVIVKLVSLIFIVNDLQVVKCLVCREFTYFNLDYLLLVEIYSFNSQKDSNFQNTSIQDY